MVYIEAPLTEGDQEDEIPERDFDMVDEMDDFEEGEDDE